MDKIIPFNTNKNKAITFIGEILVDEIYDLDNGKIIKVLGGSPANIAINIHALGIEKVYLFGTIGNDDNARLIINQLKKKGISTSNIEIGNHKTSVVRINQTTGTPLADFQRDADYHLHYTNELDEAIKNSAIVHFSYWPLSSEPSKSTIYKVIRAAKKYGTLIGFDPNYHSSLNRDDAITKEELFELMKSINITKPSIDDAIRIYGDISPEETLDKFNEFGCEFVVVSKGKDGLICRFEDVTYIYPTLATQVVDATGAGDAFYSGMYYAILNNLTLDNILFTGSACSAYNLKVVGSDSNLPKFDLLKNIYRS